MTTLSLQILRTLRDVQKNPSQENEAASLYPFSHYSLTISPRRLALAMTMVVLSLVVAHVCVQYFKFFLGHETQLGLERQFNLAKENNIPTWYSSSALLLSAVLLGMIGLVNKREDNPYTLHWFGLAAIFLFLSIDEAASLHEKIGSDVFKPMLESIGYFHGLVYFPWVIVGTTFVLIIALAYLRFLAALPIQTGSLFLIAGILFVGGALGMEMLEARYIYYYSEADFTYYMLVAVEECLEMLGVVLFVYTLLSYLGSRVRSLQILVEDETPSQR